MNKITAVPIRLWTKTRIHVNTPTNITPLLVLYCHPNNPIAGTVLLPIDNNRANMHIIY